MDISEGFLVSQKAMESLNVSLNRDRTELIHDASFRIENNTTINEANRTLEGFPQRAESFFNTYYSMSRFCTETVLALAATASNLIVLLAVRKAHAQRSVYNTLFINLAVANSLCCILFWFCNNSLVFFEDHFISMLRNGYQICLIFVYWSSAAFVPNAFGLVSTFTMLGFTTVQYYAVCKPLHHLAIIRRHRVKLCIALSWTFCFMGGVLPWAALMSVSSSTACDLDLIMTVVSASTNICIAIISLIYLLIVVLCIRIYIEIQTVHSGSIRRRQERNMHAERKAFFTIIILLSTLTVFYLPFNIIHVVTLNTKGFLQIDDSAIMYYMTLMPYLKYISDPLNYGLRMKEVRDGCMAIFVSCKCGKKNKSSVATSRSTSFVLTRMSSVNATSLHSSRL